MARPITEYREGNWICQEEEVAEDKAADRASEEAAAGARAAAAVRDKAPARGRRPRVYAAVPLAGPACPMNAASRASR